MLQAMLAEQETERQKLLRQIQQEYAQTDSTKENQRVENATQHGQRH